MKQYSLQVDGKVITTNDAGVFVIPLHQNSTYVKVSLQNRAFTILYPNGGYVLVPRNINELTEIIIGNPKENEFLNEYLKIYKQLKSNRSSTVSETTKLALRLDSLQQFLLRLHYTEIDLIRAKEIQDGKDKYYPEITENLIEFKNKAFDLKSSFAYVSDFAFDNANALQKLVEAVTNYNNIRNLLDRQHMNYEKYLNEYWQQDTLTSEFRQLVRFALDSLHEGYVLSLRDEIKLINDYFMGKKDAALKKRIQQNIKNILPAFENKLNELDRQTALFLRRISD